MNLRVASKGLASLMFVGTAFAEGVSINPGQWEFTSSGDTITGSGSMSSEAAGMELEFKMDWQGKRVGDCP